MINIKDKLNRTNILIKRTNTEAVEYVPREEYNEVLGDVNAKIEEIDEVISADYITKDELNAEINELNYKIDTYGIDFERIGYDKEETSGLFNRINNDIKYSQNLYNAWDSNNTSANRLYYSDFNLVYAPKIDTRNVTDCTEMFQYCAYLKMVPELDFSNVTTIKNIFGYSSLNHLEYLGGFRNLKIDWKDNGGLKMCPFLRYEGVMNVINCLYDFRGNGDLETTKTLQMLNRHNSLLSDDEISIATSKGWVLQII